MNTLKHYLLQGIFCLSVICLNGQSNYISSNNLIRNKIIFDSSMVACEHDSIITDTLFFDLGDGDILKLPTTFSPNGDGLDDTFYPRFNSDSIVITQYSIYTPEEWKDARIMYSSKKLKYKEGNSLIRAWNGFSKYTDDFYVRDYEGPFRFRFFATKLSADGDISRITCRGWACVKK